MQLGELQQQYGIAVSTQNSYAVENSEVVILGVKPKIVEEVCEEIKYSARGKLVISLAAAKSIASLERILTNSRVCRVMTGISVYEEMAAYTFGSQKTVRDEAVVRYIFGVSAMEVEEAALADRTWIACDTGLIAKAIEHKIGYLDELSQEDARKIYAEVFFGLAKDFREGRTGDEIYNRVAGYGSLTERVYNFLCENGVYRLIGGGVKTVVTACRK